jgi:glycosyltransferase involved in cell wall biosynthesis
MALQQNGAVVFLRNGFTQYSGLRSRIREITRHLCRDSRSLPAALDAFKPDFVVINQGGGFDIVIDNGLADWLLRNHCPFGLICQSLSEDDQLSPEAKSTANHIFAQARHITFVSSHNLTLAEHHLGRRLPNARQACNPVEFPFAFPIPWPGEAEARMAVVARLEAAPKGLDALLDALAGALRNAPGWRVNFFGEGPDSSTLLARTAALQIGDRVHFCGFQSDIRKVWADHHMLLLPSRREGCSLAMLEALACGRPVLTTAVGGTSDWISPGINGFVCAKNDIEALTATLRDAWSARSRWLEMGLAAHQRILHQLDPCPGYTLLGSIG